MHVCILYVRTIYGYRYRCQHAQEVELGRAMGTSASGVALRRDPKYSVRNLQNRALIEGIAAVVLKRVLKKP